MQDLLRNLLLGNAGGGGGGNPSLNFNFVDGSVFPSAITFTRASSATMFDSTGTLVYAPMNLLTWSEDFGNAAWTKQASVSVATNTTVAPDGTTTGDTVTADSGFGIYQQLTVTVGTQVTQSVYLRAGTATTVMFRDDTGAGRHIVVNLSTGVITSTSGVLINSGSLSMGNGWYRIYFSYAADATVVRGIIRPDSVGAGQTFIVWGGQTSLFPMQGGVTANLSTYYPTTTAAYQGPRLEYDPSTLAARGLLIEEQRTNSIRNNTMQGAVAGTPGTLPTNWVWGGTGTYQVVGTGTENGITYIDLRIQGAGAADTWNLFYENTGVVAALNGQSWTGSVYLKLVAGSTANLPFVQRLVFRNSGGTNLQSIDTAALVPTGAGLATQRSTISLTANQATTAFVTNALNSGVPTGAYDITLRIGMPQLELGAFATSVIPTTTAAATRSADVASVNTLTPWFNAAEGTLYADATSTGYVLDSGFPLVASIDDGSNANRITIQQGAASTSLSLNVRTANVSTTIGDSGFDLSSTPRRLAGAYSGTSVTISINGNTVITGTSNGVPSGLTNMKLGSAVAGYLNGLNGHLRRVTYYPARLPDAALQQITA